MEPPDGGFGPPQSIVHGKSSDFNKELPKESFPELQEELGLQPPKDFNVLQSHITEQVFHEKALKHDNDLENQTRHDVNSFKNQISDNVFQEEKPKLSTNEKELPANDIEDLQNKLSENVFKDTNTTVETTELDKKPEGNENASQDTNVDPSNVTSVPPKKNVVKRKPSYLTAARRIPEYIPDVDGNMWKVWPYPDVIELSTDTEEEDSIDPGLPPGIKRPSDMHEGHMTDEMGPPLYHKIVKCMQGALAAVYSTSIVKYLFELWKSYVTREPDEKPPGTTEDESETE